MPSQCKVQLELRSNQREQLEERVTEIFAKLSQVLDVICSLSLSHNEHVCVEERESVRVCVRLCMGE